MGMMKSTWDRNTIGWYQVQAKNALLNPLYSALSGSNYAKATTTLPIAEETDCHSASRFGTLGIGLWGITMARRRGVRRASSSGLT